MSTAEEQAKAIIKKFEMETLARLERASEDGQQQIVKFVTDYIASLQIEMPMSIKQVMDRGGQARQFQLWAPQDRPFTAVRVMLSGEPSG